MIHLFRDKWETILINSSSIFLSTSVAFVRINLILYIHLSRLTKNKTQKNEVEEQLTKNLQRITYNLLQSERTLFTIYMLTTLEKFCES